MTFDDLCRERAAQVLGEYRYKHRNSKAVIMPGDPIWGAIEVAMKALNESIPTQLSCCGCGGRGEITNYEISDGDGSQLWMVACQKCKTSTHAHYSKLIAIATWNDAMGGNKKNAGLS